MQSVINACGIEKHYPLPSRPVARLWSALRGATAGEPWHHVLRGVDFHVDRGETVGLLGRNGAGKTTLLSILAGILPPSSGEVSRRGRIVPILELGGGYDLARSGRANVTAFCEIFGLREVEIDRILPAVEEFADIGDYFDQPLRTYSSGMRSRVAFAAAMELGADLIILDETLAVGDLGFRLKCYEAIRARQRDGTAFLLVAHNPDTLVDLCDRIVVLHGGKLIHTGTPSEAVISYKRVRLGLDGQSSPSHAGATIICDNSAIEVTNEPRINLVLTIVLHPPVSEGVILSVGISTIQRIAIYASTVKLTSDLVDLQKPIFVSVSFANRLASGSYSVSARLSKIEEDAQTLAYNPELTRLIVRRNGTNDVHSQEILHLGFSAIAATR